MMEKKKIWIRYSLLAAAMVLAGIYIGGLLYFHGKFLANTDINGIDVSGRNVTEAEQQIREQVEDYKITLKERKKKSETILASDIGYHYVSNGEVLKCQKSQMYALWFVNYFKPTTYEFEAAVQFEDSLLEKKADTLNCLSASAEEPEDAKMVFRDTKFVIQKEKQGAKVRKKKFLRLLSQAILNRDGMFDLDKEDCYVKPKRTGDDPALTKLVSDMNHYADIEITYCFGDQREVLDGRIVKDWLTYDKDGKVTVKDGAIKNYIAELEEDIMPIDGLIAFAGSDMGAKVFGDAAKGVLAHAEEIKAAGAKYCDCPACAACEAILAKKDEILA